MIVCVCLPCGSMTYSPPSSPSGSSGHGGSTGFIASRRAFSAASFALLRALRCAISRANCAFRESLTLESAFVSSVCNAFLISP